ncbi:hypothetical protein B0T21DRAFT_378744 [Apiosordaria backusii]|uniref:Uncharacterized protein n=1 Tax=Apiosordaria backusii TaxID=314023 RepID=A0AA39ZQ08_9PEZI|nr:hypothetical protein B0T21DRAFT_378744 [Apiosordaria backusii]
MQHDLLFESAWNEKSLGYHHHTTSSSVPQTHAPHTTLLRPKYAHHSFPFRPPPLVSETCLSNQPPQLSCKANSPSILASHIHACIIILWSASRTKQKHHKKTNIIPSSYSNRLLAT